MVNFDIDITYECNLSCKYCNRLCGTKFNKNDFMSVSQLEKYIVAVLPHISSVSRINILGGEPTLHPQIFEVLDLLVKILRPKLSFPMNIVSNGVGERVNSILEEIRKRYNTYDNSRSITMINPYSVAKSNKDFCIVRSKFYNQKVVESRHHPNLRGLIDYKDDINIDYCWVQDNCGYNISPYGIYICSMAIAISRIFKLGEGLDHFPTPEELLNQKKKMCKYCHIKCIPLPPSPAISKSFEIAIEEWDKDPYFLKVLE
jgi:hypothetical protein